MTTFKARFYKLVFTALPIVAATCAEGTTGNFTTAGGSTAAESSSSASGMGGNAGGAGGASSSSSGAAGSGGGSDGGCKMDMDCLSGQWCNAGACNDCNTDAKCGASCMPCADPTAHCSTTGPMPVCVQCVADTDCATGATCIGGSCNDPCAMSAVTYDFEAGDQGFTHVPTSNIAGDDPWERGQPSGSIMCHGGTICFATNLGTSGYSNCQTAALVSPAIDLSKCMGTTKVVTLSFWHYYEFEPKSSGKWFDGGTLQVSADNGATWTDVSTNQPYQGVINGAYGDCTPDPEIGGHQGWSGDIPGGVWVQVSTDLPASFFVSQFKFRFLFGVDEAGNFRGWFIDDVAVTPH